MYNLIKSLDLRDDLSKPKLYANIKLISDYLDNNISIINKPELIKIIRGLKLYLSNKNLIYSNVYKFGLNEIKLDTEQLKIVNSEPNHNIRIIAGAGSGKTTTILCRIKYLLDNFITPDRILILTFNRDSAQNLRNRIESLFGFKINLQIYTIDAFCYKLMYQYNYLFNVNPLFSVSEYSNIGLELMKTYGKEIASQYKFIYFDEFQDVNDVQFLILKKFVDYGCYLTVIGDDCQNIYQFRGTNNYYIINFDQIIESQTYKLTTNYRSNKYIVNLANDSIRFNKVKVNKQMIAFNLISNKELNPKFILTGGEQDSVTYIGKKISLFIKNGINPDQIAVLSRNSYPLIMIETELTKLNIDHIACLTDKNSDDIKKILVPNKVAITTIHKSKGLEWEYVFLIGLAHEHFPSHVNNNIKNIEEERRLFYVGITRAKNYLYLIANISEIPISIFIEEIFSSLTRVKYHLEKKYSDKELFGKTESNTIIKDSYGVTELITLLQSDDFNNMRKSSLILEIDPDIQEIIKLDELNNIEYKFIDKIKSGAYEADFGEFCDRYITRQLMINNCKFFVDMDTEFILGCKELREDDINLLNLLKSNKNLLNKSKINNSKLQWLFELIEQSEKKTCDILRKYTFPSNVIRLIQNSYANAKNPELSSNNILESIYWISLCRNFRSERKRLAYKNIFDLIKLNLETKSKDNYLSLIEYMDKIIKLLSKNKTECKINLLHKFKANFSKECTICGEIDLIDLDNNELIDLKCSETDFRLEWLIQLLTYYSLYPDKSKIKFISIINIFNGKKYKFSIPDNYKYDKLLEYFEKLIKLDQLSIRSKPIDLSINLEISNNNLINNNTTINLIILNLIDIESRNYSIVLDTETSSLNGDILQLAWILLDEKNNIVSKSNYYIKDRISTKEAFAIHKISINKLREEGIEFTKVVELFVKDLEKTKIIIGHNIHYDLRCLLKNFRKYDIEFKINNNICYNIFNIFDIICTKKMSGNKSLENLYLDLFNKNFINAHDALTDVINTHKCYVKLLEKQNLIDHTK